MSSLKAESNEVSMVIAKHDQSALMHLQRTSDSDR